MYDFMLVGETEDPLVGYRPNVGFGLDGPLPKLM